MFYYLPINILFLYFSAVKKMRAQKCNLKIKYRDEAVCDPCDEASELA